MYHYTLVNTFIKKNINSCYNDVGDNMYINNKILIGKNENESYILPSMANRHGIITGASGSGKTITLKVMAESFSEAGVPVFLADVKGDLAGMCMPGEANEKINERLNELKIDNFEFKDFPTHYFDVYGKMGHPIRTTVENIGARLLARMLNLTEVQEGVLAIIFKIAEDNDWKLIDLKDLKTILQYVGDNRNEYTTTYGNISSQSIGAIQRNLLMLVEEGGDYFFGEPAFNIKDFIKYDAQSGRGYINVLDAQELFNHPNLYAIFLLWLLSTLFSELEEVGDVDKPKIVFFFDEAHLLFEDMPDYLVKNITQIVKLIRSKGIGLYFISQSPKDIPDEISTQLGNRIQHALRAYTPAEQKVIQAASMSFRTNPNFKTDEAIMSLGTGEALVSFQNEDGEPTIVERVTILPPQSKMGTISDTTRMMVLEKSLLKNKYDTLVESESAFEKINEVKKVEEEELAKELKKKEEEKLAIEKAKATPKKKTSKMDKALNSAATAIGRNIGNSIFKSLFK